ncbi:divalent-cation tolerance protein CutA [Methanolapillus millepedarum]|uniref:Divalent-cation tolerance protein CutA n=1 Tax=Methanolapillus millepedarum TaxID=3028296 RepID=A0AA96VDW4_9EURY|nr:Divalent-cation tolerance protein CutA [Methanosarcinaceae archaeon Ac7]
MTNDSNTNYIFIYTTFPTKKSAKKTAQKLIEKKEIVSANIRKHTAIYTYAGKLHDEKEYGCIFKTREDKWKSVEAYVLKKHPYETPVLIKINIDESNSGFQNWVDENLTIIFNQ